MCLVRVDIGTDGHHVGLGMIQAVQIELIWVIEAHGQRHVSKRGSNKTVRIMVGNIGGRVYLVLACVSICDLRLVLWAKRLLQPANEHTNGRSPVWIRIWVRRLKSRLNFLPQPSNGHLKRARQFKKKHQSIIIIESRT